MRLFVIGASGRTGRQVVHQALHRGHLVTGLFRTLPRVVEPHMRIVTGDPRRSENLMPHLGGHDAVISCLGQRAPEDALLLADASAATLAAMKEAQVSRIVTVSQGLLFPSANPLVGLLRLFLARQVKDSRRMEDNLRRSAAEWTILRPPRLADGRPACGFRIMQGAMPPAGWSMGYADLASCVLDIVEKRDHVRKIVGVGSA